MRDLRVRGLDGIPPADVEEALVDPGSGLQANESCAGAVSVPFMAGYTPSEAAPCAGGLLDKPAEWLKEIFQ